MNYNATWEPSSGSRGRRPYRAALRTGVGVRPPSGFAFRTFGGLPLNLNGTYPIYRIS